MKLNDLDALIPQYAQNKADLDSYKKICEDENRQIKSIMADYAVQNYETGGYKASYSITTRENFNEDRLLEFMKDSKVLVDSDETVYEIGLIKTREYVDYDVLERLLYNQKITPYGLKKIEDCREVKEVVTLRITKSKGKKVKE